MLTAEQLQHYRQQGYALTEPLFTPAELDHLIEQIEAVRAAGRTPIMRGNNPFQGGLEAEHDFAIGAITHPRVLAVVQQILGDEVDLFSGSQIAYKPPRSGSSFVWHQDAGYSYVEPADYLTCWLALDDATVENGTIWVIPQSHQWGRLRHYRSSTNRTDRVGYEESAAYQGVPICAQRGQMAVFSALTLHKSGQNVTDQPRRAWVMQYCRPGAYNPRYGCLYSTIALIRHGRRLCETFLPLHQIAQKRFDPADVIEGNQAPVAELARLAAQASGGRGAAACD